MVAAREEASKFLILLDAVRCPRRPIERLSQHLRRYNEHLAKALYAEACRWSPATYADLERYLADERDELYLDGMDYSQWIFRNRLLNSRESATYVDYVATEEGHYWSGPPPLEGREHLFCIDTIFTLVCALHSVGLTDAAALRTIARVWRALEVTPELHWKSVQELSACTLETPDTQSLLGAAPDQTYATILQNWTFPLYGADMSLVEVKPADLRAAREAAFLHEMVGNYY